jgi:penicillin amidase
MFRIFRAVITGLIALLLVVSLALAAFIPYSIRRAFPRIDGEIRVDGLDAPVDIIRDPLGVPHIYASTRHDLFFTQGYVHAQDRYWQMDFWRHIGSGRLAEMFGEDQVETDTFLRTLGWARVVEQELAAIDADSLAILQAYSDGVNAYLADHRGTALSLEYLFLGILNSEYEVEPWQPLHTLTWAKAMAWDLGGNMDEEIGRALMMQSLDPAEVAELMPSYPSDMPVIVPDFQITANRAGQANQPEYQEILKAAAPALKGLQALQAKLGAAESALGARESGIGSNSWVISGALTDTGKPILANDPHLGAQMPSIWYEIGLHCKPKGEGCPYEVAGVSFAGAPGVIIGHNDRIAWGFTNVGPDVQDLYIEKVNPDNPNQYEVNGKWQDMQLIQETIEVGGGAPVQVTVRYTRHGPILSDTGFFPEGFRPLEGAELTEPYAIALRWTALEPNFIFRAIWQFNRASNWEEFREGAAELAAPAQNLVYADLDGNIGYQMPGWIPIRAGGDGALPVPGWTDDYEWTGYIPFEELPRTFNPPQGYVVTANNAVVGEDYPYLISLVYDHGYRARRIVQMIEEGPRPFDLAYMKEMQGDNKDLNAEILVPILMNVSVAADLEPARQLLAGWDYQAHMDSAPAAVFEAFWKNLLLIAFQDDLPEESWPSGGSHWFEVVKNLAGQPDSHWWDNKTTAEIEDRDAIFGQALAAAVAELDEELGNDPSLWSWGDLHTLTLTNETLGQSGISPIETLFNRGPFRTSGGSSIVNATGWDAAESYEVGSLPSMRMIVDLSGLSNSWMIHTSGQSGHAYNRHYADMTDLWRTIQYHPLRWELDQVEDGAEGRLRLLP